MPGLLGQLHEKDWGARGLVLYLGGTAGWRALPWGSRAGAGSSPRRACHNGRDAHGLVDLLVLPLLKDIFSKSNMIKNI